MSLSMPQPGSSSSTYSSGEASLGVLVCSHCLVGMACVIKVVARVVN